MTFKAYKFVGFVFIAMGISTYSTDYNSALRTDATRGCLVAIIAIFIGAAFLACEDKR